ncbi:hypothetical protein [Nonomuraea jiangxiensis]|uniref:Lipoprotein n=1 Tax=Nonomuraea jiangxiensis TaxID=633440 RepID=A0A1G9I5A4_9ACTN|nr:hypothetical protein [Nonomuraea jiangxiensis]SDL20428.1 hypothetical protein SAMN05421869_12387 [Nonomuraea jiangxiensis]
MNRTITALPVLAAVLLLSAVPAQAAAPEPVRALKATLVPGHGVHFTEVATWSNGLDTLQTDTAQGVLQFSKKGVAGYDVRSTTWDDEKYRAVSVGDTAYYSGAIYQLPKGKTWFATGGGALPTIYGQILNPVELTTLSALLKKGTKAGNKITGKITFTDLAKVSQWFSRSVLTDWDDDTEISYTLTLNSAGLVSKLSSSYRAKDVTEDFAEFEGGIIAVDTRYSGWGSKVSVKAPDPKGVTYKLPE